MISVNDLRQGTLFEQDGTVYQVESFKRHKMARAKAIVNLTVRDIKNGGIKELSFKSGDSVEEAEVENKSLSFVYHDERKGQVIFQDPENKKRIQLDTEVLGDEVVGYLTEGAEVIALVGIEKGQEQVYTVTLPRTVELEVTEAPPNDKGDTASGGTKPVTVETGITVNTPFFIATGDVIKVNTESGEYIERVKK